MKLYYLSVGRILMKDYIYNIQLVESFFIKTFMTLEQEKVKENFFIQQVTLYTL